MKRWERSGSTPLYEAWIKCWKQTEAIAESSSSGHRLSTVLTITITLPATRCMHFVLNADAVERWCARTVRDGCDEGCGGGAGWRGGAENARDQAADAARGARGRPPRARAQGRAAQADPIKPVLKAPGSLLLKLRCDGPLSNVAFNFNLRRCTKEGEADPGLRSGFSFANAAAGGGGGRASPVPRLSFQRSPLAVAAVGLPLKPMSRTRLALAVAAVGLSPKPLESSHLEYSKTLTLSWDGDTT